MQLLLRARCSNRNGPKAVIRRWHLRTRSRGGFGLREAFQWINIEVLLRALLTSLHDALIQTNPMRLSFMHPSGRDLDVGAALAVAHRFLD